MQFPNVKHPTLRRSRFTLNEMLIAVGLLVILAVVLLRLFGAASALWRASETQGRLYGDAKVALDVFTEDVGNILYRSRVQNDAGNYPVLAPIWLSTVGSAVEPADPYVENYVSGSGNTKSFHVVGLFFVSRTNRADGSASNPLDDAKSNIAEIGWYYNPATCRLYRVVIPSITQAGAYNLPFNADGFNYTPGITSGLPYSAEDTYANLTNGAAQTAYASGTNNDYEVISGVLSVQFNLYGDLTNGNGSANLPYAPFGTPQVYTGRDAIGGSSGQEYKGNFRTDKITAADGAVDVAWIQIAMTLMPEARIRELSAMPHDSAEDLAARQEFIREYGRTFTKTIPVR